MNNDIYDPHAHRTNRRQSSRAEAIAAGETFYRTGKPCKNGHVSDRYISGRCVTCQRENSKKRNKPWLLGSKHLQIDRMKEERQLEKELNYLENVQ